MTYSLIARDPATGETGIAVASRFFACGAIVPWLGRRAAVATQSFVNPIWCVEGVTVWRRARRPGMCWPIWWRATPAATSARAI